MSGDSFEFGRRRFLQTTGAGIAGLCLSTGVGASTGRQTEQAPSEDEYEDILAEMDGDGSEENPYIITDVVELQAINGDLTAQYQLGDDIDASVTAEWNDGAGFKPLFREGTDGSSDGSEDGSSGGSQDGSSDDSGGDSSDGEDNDGSNGQEPTVFTGLLEGKGHEISGLTINRPEERGAGLFFINNGIIADFVLTDASVTGKTAGLVAGSSRGGIGEIVADGTVTGEEDVGGITGTTEGLVTKTEADVDVTGTTRVGGLVGNSNGNIINNSVSGTVDGETDIGGVVGKSSNYIEKSDTDATVSGTARVGGFVGDMSGRVAACTASGSVTGENKVGGFVGECWGKLFGSTSRTSVEGNENVGGLVGENYGEIGVCSVHGDVTGSSRVGGIVGWGTAGTVVADSYSVASVTGDSAVGALVGLLGWEFLADEETAELRRAYWSVGETDHDPVGSLKIGDGEVTVAEETIAGLESDQFVGKSASEHMTAFDFEQHWRTRAEKMPIPRAQAATVFELSLTSSSQIKVSEDETFAVETEVENTGDLAGTQSISLVVGGEQFESTEQQLDSGETTQVTFADLPASDVPIGIHNFAVRTKDDTVEGTIEVQRSTSDESDGDGTPSDDNGTSTPTAEPTDGADDDGPGFGVGAALTGIGTGAALLSRRLGRDKSSDD
jgi:PGF-CTERM protein